MSELLRPEYADGITIVYDGKCPFCTAYVRLLRLRETVPDPVLIDARARPDIVAELDRRGFKLDEGMVVYYKDTLYFGGDAMHVLGLLTTPVGPVNSLFAGLLSKRWFVHWAYPALRTGRKLTLKALGRPPIGDGRVLQAP